MNKNTIICYAMIMLECRLSLADASLIFHVKEEVLEESLNPEALLNLYPAIKYLYYETRYYSKENTRGKFKAEIYLRRLRKILNEKDKNKRKDELNKLLDDLSGPSIRFVLENDNKHKYTSEEREKILKYRLKFALSAKSLKNDFHLDPKRVAIWIEELPNGELKERLTILTEYKKDRYFNYLSNRLKI